LGLERIALFACTCTIIYATSLVGLALHLNFQAFAELEAIFAPNHPCAIRETHCASFMQG
jgi:hypothetical protein